MISGEKIALPLEGNQEESEVQIPAVLAALLEQNEHARNQFYKLSKEHKLRLIQNIRSIGEMDKQISMSLKLLNGIR